MAFWEVFLDKIYLKDKEIRPPEMGGFFMAIFVETRPKTVINTQIHKGVGDNNKMGERAEQMYWIHSRGVAITLPPPITEKISGPISRGECVDPIQYHRLYLIENNSILKKRLPQDTDGERYMYRVDLKWRERLLEEVQKIAFVIKKSVKEVTGFSDEDFAIILFGSVARGLCRNSSDEDPSNIDISVIGDFSDLDRGEIFERIRPDREKGGERIGNNIGIFLQTKEKLAKDNYSSVIQFIGACGYALHDPGNIWHNIETEALMSSIIKANKKISRLHGNGLSMGRMVQGIQTSNQPKLNEPNPVQGSFQI